MGDQRPVHGSIRRSRTNRFCTNHRSHLALGNYTVCCVLCALLFCPLPFLRNRGLAPRLLVHRQTIIILLFPDVPCIGWWNQNSAMGTHMSCQFPVHTPIFQKVQKVMQKKFSEFSHSVLGLFYEMYGVDGDTLVSICMIASSLMQ